MNVIPCTQGSVEWHQARLGIPTASEFSRLITPTGKPSKQSDAYIYRLLAEWVMGIPVDDGFESQWMQRGHELEAEAVAAVEWAENIETETVGFITTDDGRYGCSPDRLVKGKRWGCEIKCPAPQTHIGYLIGATVSDDYKPQVQGCLLVTGYDEWLVTAYCPGFPASILRIGRDEEYIGKLRDALDSFCERLAAAKQTLRERYGVEPKRPATTQPAVDKYGFDLTDNDVAAIYAATKEKE